VGTSMLIQRLLMGFFWSSIFEMGRNVRNGNFDFMLAQPGNVLFMASTRKLDPDGLINSFVALAVVLYAARAYFSLAAAPDWAGALYDGAIRLCLETGHERETELVEMLTHELVHALLSRATEHRAPPWLQEGLAQWMEGRRTNGDAAQLVAFYEQGQGKQLRYFDDSWTRFSTGQARFAYAWSLAVVEMVEAEHGSDGINRLLEAERAESSREAALREGLRMNFSSLDEVTIDYLKKTYLQ